MANRHLLHPRHLGSTKRLLKACQWLPLTQVCAMIVFEHVLIGKGGMNCKCALPRMGEMQSGGVEPVSSI